MICPRFRNIPRNRDDTAKIENMYTQKLKLKFSCMSHARVNTEVSQALSDVQTTQEGERERERGMVHAMKRGEFLLVDETSDVVHLSCTSISRGNKASS